MNAGGINCRVEGCRFVYRPRVDTKLGRVLGSCPGGVDLSTLDEWRTGTFSAGDTLNNIASFGGAELHSLRAAMLKHHERHHGGVELTPNLKPRVGNCLVCWSRRPTT